MSQCFLASRHNIGDIVTKFAFIANLHTPYNKKFENYGLKDEVPLYNLWIWALFVTFSKSMNFIRRLNGKKFYV